MKKRNYGFWLYLLGGYILIQFIWWAWMLIDINQQLLVYEQVQNDSMSLSASNKSKVWMIIGEGSVFLVLLILGFYQVRKALRKEVEQANQQRNFLLSVTHELNSPLAGIQLNLETVTARSLDEDKRNKLIRRAVSETQRLKRLVSNILTSARIDEGKITLKLERKNLSQVVNSFFSGFKLATSHQIKLDINEDVYAHFDELAMESVLRNLVENAAKYSAVDTEITIQLNTVHAGAELVVIDQGIGIDALHIDKIFNRFYRIENEEIRETKGTGLGLYIVKYLVERQNGRLIVESDGKKGSTFRVQLKK